MPRRESGKPLQSGRVRVIRDQVQDDPYDKRTWDPDQHWSVISTRQLGREVSTYPSKKLRKMLRYYRAFHMAKHRGVIARELERRKAS
jgi:hypothetical protein